MLHFVPDEVDDPDYLIQHRALKLKYMRVGWYVQMKT